MTAEEERGTNMRRTIDVGGTVRTYTVVGEQNSTQHRDLVLIFHGSKQNGDTHRRFTGRAFDAMAGSGAAVVAYLDGYKGNWNDARKESSFPARLENVDDVGFAAGVINDLEASYGIDRERVFALGYSNGGQMVFRLIHERPDLFAGAAVFSATMPAPENFQLPFPVPQTVAMPLLLIHGTKDRVVPYRGGTMRGWARRMFKAGGVTRSMPATAEYFARRNQITSDPVVNRVPKAAGASSTTWIEQTDYRQADHPAVRLFTVHNGGHTIPGPAKAPFILGKTGQDISAAAATAAFFDIAPRRVRV